MMYESGKDKVKEMHEAFGRVSGDVRMALVTAIEAERPVIKFYGENVSASKKYTYLSSYVPKVGDTVALIRIGKSYIILGKVV